MNKKTEIYELSPITSQKSFSGKAKVIIIGNKRYLRSYDTIMGCIDLATNEIHRYSDYKSHTTCKHIKSFLPYDYKKFWNLPIEEQPEITVVL